MGALWGCEGLCHLRKSVLRVVITVAAFTSSLNMHAC